MTKMDESTALYCFNLYDAPCPLRSLHALAPLSLLVCGGIFETSLVGPIDGRNHLLTKHRGIVQRLLIEQQNHCAALASACCAKFQSVLAWLQRKPKDIEEVNKA